MISSKLLLAVNLNCDSHPEYFCLLDLKQVYQCLVIRQPRLQSSPKHLISDVISCRKLLLNFQTNKHCIRCLQVATRTFLMDFFMSRRKYHFTPFKTVRFVTLKISKHLSLKSTTVNKIAVVLFVGQTEYIINKSVFGFLLTNKIIPTANGFRFFIFQILEVLPQT